MEGIKRAVIFIVIFAFTPNLTFAADGTLKQCKGYHKRIDYYTALRRNGGSANSMEKWKQKRNNYKDRYREKNCRKWGSKLNE